MQINYGDSTPLGIFDAYLSDGEGRADIDCLVDFQFRTKRVPLLLSHTCLMREYSVSQGEGLSIYELRTGFAQYRKTPQAQARMDYLIAQSAELVPKSSDYDALLDTLIDQDIVESFL